MHKKRRFKFVGRRFFIESDFIKQNLKSQKLISKRKIQKMKFNFQKFNFKNPTFRILFQNAISKNPRCEQLSETPFQKSSFKKSPFLTPAFSNQPCGTSSAYLTLTVLTIVASEYGVMSKMSRIFPL